MQRNFRFRKVAWVVSGFILSLGISACLIAEDQTVTQMTNAEFLAYKDAANGDAAKPEKAPVAAGEEYAADVYSPDKCSHWNVGVEAVWLSPTQKGSNIDYQIQSATSPTPFAYDSSGSATNGFYMTPRLWLGYQWEKWGVVARYWRMNEGRDQFCPNTTLALGSSSSNFFKAETFDLEATRLLNWKKTRNVLSGGLRYAELNQAQRVTVSQTFGTEGFLGSSYSRHQFSGVGLTMGLNGLRPIGDSPHLNLFYSARGSILFDDNQSANTVESQVMYGGGLGAGNSIHGATSGGNSNLFVGEIQVGVQWNYVLVENRADAFFRFAFEYQYWDTSSTGCAEATSFISTPTQLAVATSRSGDARVDLVGFTVSTGFTW